MRGLLSPIVLAGALMVPVGCVRQVDRVGLVHDRRPDFAQGSILMPIDQRWRYAGTADGRDHLVYGTLTGIGVTYTTFAISSDQVELPERWPLREDERTWIALVAVELSIDQVRFRRLGVDEVRAWEQSLIPKFAR